MGLPQVPPGIKDPNLANFLRQLRNSIAGVPDQVNRIISSRMPTGGSGGGGGDNGGGDGGGGGGTPGTPAPVVTVTLSASPLSPKDGDDITLTVSVIGDSPTGTVRITQNSLDLITLTLSNSSASYVITGGLATGTYTFIAYYSGDPRNPAAVSNTVTVEVGSSWAGRPAPPSNLSARGDMWAVYLDWVTPFIGDYAHTEVWASDSITTFDATTYDALDPPAGVSKVADVTGSSFTFLRWDNADLVAGQTYYFWVRNVDKESLFSTWVPAGNGAAATVLNDPERYLDILTGQITETQLFSSLGDKIDLIVPLDERVNTAETDIISLQHEDINLYAQLSLVSAGATGFDTAKIWHFDSSSDITGWTVTNASSLSVSGGLLTFTPTAAASSFSTAAISVSGSAYQIVKIRIKRVSGTEGTDWIGRLTYYYASTSSSLTISEPTYDANGWATAEWDLSGEANWTGNTITKLEVSLGDAASSPWGGVFTIDWMAVGRNAPSASVAQVADLSAAQIGYCVISGSPSNHESKATCEAAGGTWYGNLPLAQAVKQVSVTDGVTTGTIEQKFTAQKTNLDSLNLQYTVKIDNNGYVSGFGLASVAVDGVPYSDFMVRADRFSIVSPNIPSLRVQVSGSLTHNGTTATVTTVSTHPFAVDDTVVLSNVANAHWNRAFKVTAKTGTTFSFAVHASNPLSLHPDAAATTAAVSGKTAYALKVTIPFVVLTTTDSNGTPPGVYMSEAYMKYAAITRLHVKDGEMVNAKIGNAIYSNNWPTTGGVPNTYPPVGSAFNGWILDKVNGLRVYGSGFGLYDANQNPIIEAGGLINGGKLKRMILTASAEVFSIPKAPSTTITPATITVNATAQNLTGLTVNWSVTSGTYTGTLNNGVSSQTINPANMTTPVLTLRAWVTDTNSVVYEDFLTLAKVQEGTDALFLYLSNENDALPADANGVLTGATSVVSAVKVYRGATDVTSSEGWTITPTSSDANTAVSYSAGTVTITMASNSADRVTVTVTATKSGSPTQTRVITVSKQRQGVTGSSGVTLVLSNESHTVPTAPDGSNGIFTGAVCTATIYEGTTDTSASWSFSQATSGVTSTASNSNRTATVSAMSGDTGYVDFTAAKMGQTVTRRFSVSKSKSGKSVSIAASALTRSKTAAGIISPYQITFTANGVGTTGTPTWYFWYPNQTPFTNVFATAASTTINVDRNDSATDGSHPITPSGYWGTADSTLSIGVILDGVRDFVTLSEVREGATGAPGASAYSMILSNESHTLPAKADGTVISYSGATCTATVYLGAAVNAGWSFAGSPASSGTLTYTQSGGTFTITGMAAATDTAYIDITASKSGQPSITRRFSVSKSKAGQTLSISASTQIVNGTTSVTPAQFTLSAVGTVPTANLVWEYSNSQGATPTWSSYVSGVSSVGPIGSNYANRNATYGWFDEAQTIFRVRVTDSATGISDTITITRVVDGSSGDRGAGWYYATGSSWNDATANAATPGDNQIADAVTISNGSTFSETRVWDGTNWVAYGTRLSGNVFLNGSVIVEKLAGGTITGKNIYLDGGTIRTLNYAPGSLGWKIDGDGNAEFNTVFVRTGNLQSNAVTAVDFVKGGNNYSLALSTGTLATYTKAAVTTGTRGKTYFQAVFSVFNDNANSSAGYISVTISTNTAKSATTEIYMPLGQYKSNFTACLIDDSLSASSITFTIAVGVSVTTGSTTFFCHYVYSAIEARR